MSTQLFIKISFLEPYRIVEPETDDNKERYRRSQTYAQWLIKKNETKKGSPWIIGTLLRSAVIRSAEELLSLTNGNWNGEKCCKGEFHTDKSKEQPKYLRKRHIAEWDSSESNCSSYNPCPYCILSGRKFDGTANKYKKGIDPQPKREKYPLHFENLHLQKLEYFENISDIAAERTLNRVDPVTGKALDYFSMYEVVNKNFRTFCGKITISEPKVEDFLKNALMFIDKICGAQCKIEVSENPFDQTTTEYESIKLDGDLTNKIHKCADDIIKAFNESGKLDKVRVLADAVRMMRIKDSDIISKLPLGRDEYGHFLWDKIKINGKELRKVLAELVTVEMKQNKGLLRKVYEELGQKLYEKLKKAQHKDIETIRPLGENENYSEQNPFDFQIPIKRNTAVKEFIFTGTLVSQTPFYIGKDSVDGEHTNMQILLTEDGHYRIPRSVLRGAIRRDLRYASDNAGCNVDLGPDNPCVCPVCILMRKITVNDTTNEKYTQAPDVRNRIRMNPYTATVDGEALFDMEVGPEGLEFNFVLRYRGTDIPAELYSVMHYWKELSFLGGSDSTGKGRFALKNLKIFSWDLFDSGLTAYIEQYGKREKKRENESEFFNIDDTEKDFIRTYELEGKNLEQKLVPYNEYLQPRWKKIVYSLEFSSPLLTADPIAALIEEGNRDSIAYEKRIVLKGEPVSVVAIKAETFRGIVRTSTGKRTGDLEKDHEECTCKLCSIFGNEHKEGKIRFEDLIPVTEDPVNQKLVPLFKTEKKKIDHVAIDRFHGGAEDSMKFDSYPIIASDSLAPLKFEGILWIKNDLVKDIEIIEESFYEISKGLYPIGGKTGTGYGWISKIKIDEKTPGFELKESFTEQPVEISKEPLDALPPDIHIDNSSIYYPHYFLKQEAVNRDGSEMIFHDKWNEKYFSGKITCSLETRKPLIIPDPIEPEPDKNIHHNYKFFNINDEVIIPGSETRGMISNVYEALTNSCFRIVDETEKLSWRMEAKNLSRTFFPGKIKIEKEPNTNKEKFKIILLNKSIATLPFYDEEISFKDFSEDQINGIAEVELWVKEFFTQVQIVEPTRNIKRWKKLKGTFKKISNNKYSIAFTYHNNQKTITKTVEGSELTKYNEQNNGKIDFWYLEIPLFKALLNKPVDEEGWEHKTGYLKVTGPNKVELSQEKESSNVMYDKLPGSWQDVRINGKKIELNGAKTKVFRCTDGSNFYTMSKWRETFFYFENEEKHKKPDVRPVDPKAVEHYRMLIDKYKDNPQSPPEIFQSLPVVQNSNNRLKDGDLVYYKLNEDKSKVIEIVPVRISRHFDWNYLWKKDGMDDLRPCERVWIEDDKMPPEYKTDPMLRGLRRNFLLHEDGYCPACRLFGTTYFQGRLNFGFAHLEGIPKWENNGDFITLPLLEKPRPTWSIPNDNLTIPGRKFYLHHDGWKEVINNQPSLSKDKNKNNRSVQILSEGNTFVFDIYFENLEKKELGLLLYCLELEQRTPQNTNNDSSKGDLEWAMAHKLGMGKPLGFGSVKIDVTKLVLFNFDKKDKPVATTKEFIDAGLQSLGEDWYIKLEPLRKLLMLPSQEVLKVKYPKLEEKDAKADGTSGYSYEKLRDEKVLTINKRIEQLQIPWFPWLNGENNKPINDKIEVKKNE